MDNRLPIIPPRYLEDTYPRFMGDPMDGCKHVFASKPLRSWSAQLICVSSLIIMGCAVGAPDRGTAKTEKLASRTQSAAQPASFDAEFVRLPELKAPDTEYAGGGDISSGGVYRRIEHDVTEDAEQTLAAFRAAETAIWLEDVEASHQVEAASATVATMDSEFPIEPMTAPAWVADEAPAAATMTETGDGHTPRPSQVALELGQDTEIVAPAEIVAPDSDIDASGDDPELAHLDKTPSGEARVPTRLPPEDSTEDSAVIAAQHTTEQEESFEELTEPDA